MEKTCETMHRIPQFEKALRKTIKKKKINVIFLTINYQ